MVAAEVTTSVRGLNDHGLSGDGGGGEGDLVAGAAPRRLSAATEGRGGETVGEVVADLPGREVAAGVCAATVTSALGVGAAEGVVVRVACVDWGAHVGLAGPCARGLAAVPVSF